MDDLLRDFLTETTESLSALDLDLVTLEKNPHDGELIGRIFRLVHSVKGNCGFLGLPRLESVAHHAESVLGQYRKGALRVTPDSVSLILQSLDRIKGIVSGLAETGQEPPGDDKALICLLDMAADTGGKAQLPVIAQGAQAAEEVASKSLRVNVETLEDIMTQVGELVLARNRLFQLEAEAPAPGYRQPVQDLGLAVAGLQESVMKARMQPVGMLMSRLPRVVRDIGIDLGKQIRLETEGVETELDRQVLEHIRDPLVHLVRNAAGHGIEKPAVRVAAGKPPEGTVRLCASHEGGQVIIEVSDDGCGLDTALIGQKAVEKGLLTKASLGNMPARQIQQLVFAPGFSTAREITALSGRGVGLDVVHSNLGKIGGTVDMATAAGKGTRFTLRIPLTLAILPALLVSVEGERYALPLGAVQEVVRLTRRGKHVLERIGGAKVLRLRGRLLPVISLQGLLGSDDLAAKALNPFVAIITQRGGQYGIIVDDTGTAEEIVVKPLSPVLRGQSLFSGNAVLGDGGVAMILDPSGIADAAGVDMAIGQALAEPAQPEIQKIPMLLFHAGAPCAIPLSSVARLEQFPANTVEFAGGGRVVQYRGGVLPLRPFHPATAFAGKGRISVLVLGEGQSRIGVVVEQIMDIVEAPLDIIPGHGACPWLLGSAVVGGQVMDIADAAYFTAGRNGA